MRLFVAINLVDNTRARLLALRDELRSRSERGNFSMAENLHLTLAFLGECGSAQAAAAKQAISAVSFVPFPISIERIGRFKSGGKHRVPAKWHDFAGKGAATEQAGFSPSDGNEQVQSAATWWAGVQASKPLLSLQSDLTDRLIDKGFILDKRRYSPHITLGREVVTDAAPWRISTFGETVTGIDLMKSERINGKLTYTAIYGMTP